MNVYKLNIEDNIAAGFLKIVIYLSPIPVGIELSPKLKNLGDFVIGNDDDSDLILMPGEVNCEIYFQEHIKDLIDLFNYINYRISVAWNEVYIYLNNNLIWQGFIDKDINKLKLDRQNKTIKLSFVEQFAFVKNYDPKTNPLFYQNLNDFRKITDIIKDIFTVPFVNAYVNSIINGSTIEGRILVNYTDYITFQFSEFMASLSFYYGNNSNYSTLADVLKSILFNYNLICYMGFERKLFLIPRFVEFNNIIQINTNELLSSPNYQAISPIKGVKVKVWKGSYPKDDTNYYIYTLGNYVQGDENCEELIIDQPAGSFPGGGYSGIAVIYNSQIYWIEFDNIRYKKLDGTFSDYKALYKIIADDNWSQIRYPRLKCDIEVNGLFDKWMPGYYKLPDSDIVFRAVKFNYNFLQNSTKISLRQAGIMPSNYRLLEDNSYKINEDFSKRLLEKIIGGTYQLINYYRLTEDGQYRLTEDYNKRLI
ncbi:MAG: hypothetical protein WHS65_12800 [Melioribacteraceae bacterium]